VPNDYNSHLRVCGPGYHSRYRDSLQAGLSGDSTQGGGGGNFPYPPRLLYNGYHVSFPPRGTAVGVWH
jgi:hypothetical protein